MARLETLSIFSLTPAIVKQLSNRKILTVIDFIAESTENLLKITGMAYKSILEIRKEIVAAHGGKLENTLELLKREEEIISTGIPSFDDLLNGGLHPGEIYEFCGASSTGKTSMCLSISTDLALNSDFVIHYVDTKRDFSSSRVQMILDEKKISNEEIARVMNQIKLSRIHKLPELFSILHSLAPGKDDRVKLIIIDSLASLVHVAPDNYESLYSMNHLTSVCKYLAKECSLSVITINSITQWRDDLSNLENSGVIKPMLGRYWRGIPGTRIYFEEMYNERRKLTLWKSNVHPIGKSIDVKIINSGII
ncbi:DNA repair protein RAD51 homolog 4 [Fopius arisanus]|uniref:DNA repair protein RAD51 homolog 4 n=1 Tax=Fopius arisanus TaxID=64838 RepID=A0A9R1SU79_9HYME|nr:PREDICTED: DNA repair protein RAD51 homolog 4 [Fopius arisanus]XP_011297199.1 PREDICTED: DNA repair protein RAD51 homolog 4 [Fopius arisanus]XP_011297200.1 PREDICTED: DNA repair protein RAD51 homolog 4 [Fopius arisanus]